MSQSLPAPWPELRHGDLKSVTLLDRLQLSLRRDAGEYRLDYRFLKYSPNGADGAVEAPPFAPEFSVRYLFTDKLTASATDSLLPKHKPNGAGDKTSDLVLAPQLADRAVVSQPLISVELPPQHSATLLISTPLWVQLRTGDRQLVELPTTRLSDTWFGPNTRHGELCYAVQTRARLSLENTSDSPFRALTPVTITNSGGDNLKLDRINVPVPHLSLYCDGERFWTSAITIERERNWVSARVQIGEGPPQQAPAARKIAEPRRPIRGGVLERAVDLLFA